MQLINRKSESLLLHYHAFAVMLVCMMILGSTAFARRTGSSPNEYEIKAAFLYNFASFVEWPPKTSADSSGSFIIGVCGDNPFGNTLEKTVKGKTINGRRIDVRYFGSARDLKPCHILFVSSSEDNHFGKIANTVRDWHVLTVADTDGFTRNGGIINFFTEDNKIKFEINADNAKKSGLKISSKLLKLAKVVKG
ncbi:YfiR family protein [bacterium]|nr:YfiR family protein [bacterium]